MRFLTTLLPLITLAVHVAATNSEQGSIPLTILRPGAVHLPDPPPPYNPPTYDEATRSHAIIPPPHYSSAQSGVEQPPLSGISPRCQQEARQRALELARQELGPNHGDVSNLRAVMERVTTSVGDAFMRHPGRVIACFLVTATVASATVAIYLSNCGKGDWACINKRDGFGSNPQCKHLDIEVCRNPSPTDTHSPSKATGGHGKRDAARMSYRRRLELV
ncbi:MAG: hypothetical protein NXY57DRAFT_969979 [Lentinula lateritia]|uniref:Uncharacterized protein n=1 Tax=Lentinula lateritia TaxID=40482 RepID=A0ABQ8V628_9AGAR|nr:MAG: hypothetical protein NXY57DRAFT_969979 [Lentinula lateritia]KAJ4476180.1 hypothetical protein C8R41DRAFT_923512 [Lentinula lateritia]